MNASVTIAASQNLNSFSMVDVFVYFYGKMGDKVQISKGILTRGGKEVTKGGEMVMDAQLFEYEYIAEV